MEEFEKRLIREYTDLKGKFERLQKFIRKDEYRNLYPLEQQLLTKQLAYMQGYLIALEDRIEYRGLIEGGK